MAACYLILFVGGTFMAQLPREVSFRGSLYDFHKSIGITTIGLLTARILVLLQVWWRKYAHRLPRFSPAWFRVAALHSLLYVFMLVVPVTGVFLSNSFKAGNVKWFGFVLPDIFPQSTAAVDLARSLHFWLAYTFLAFVVLHMLDQRKVLRALWRRLRGALTQRTESRV
jgi:cytochrome b561